MPHSGDVRGHNLLIQEELIIDEHQTLYIDNIFNKTTDNGIIIENVLVKDGSIIADTMHADLTGNITGDITSAGTSVFTGTVNFTGAHTIGLVGNLVGNLTGDVCGNLYGNYIQNKTGNDLTIAGQGNKLRAILDLDKSCNDGQGKRTVQTFSYVTGNGGPLPSNSSGTICTLFPNLSTNNAMAVYDIDARIIMIDHLSGSFGASWHMQATVIANSVPAFITIINTNVTEVGNSAGPPTDVGLGINGNNLIIVGIGHPSNATDWAGTVTMQMVSNYV